MSERTSSSVSVFQVDATNSHLEFLGNHPVQEQRRNLACSASQPRSSRNTPRPMTGR